MGRAVALRDDFDGPVLRRLARFSTDAGQSRRLLSLAEIYDGGKRLDAARIGDVGLQVVRDWVLRFNRHGPDGLIDGKSTGQPPKLNDVQRRALAEIVGSGPIPAVHGIVRWRRKDLAQWIFEEFHISLDETTVGRELKALGFVKISARPRHKGQNEFAIEDFKKIPGRSGRDPRCPPGKYQDRNLVAGRGEGWPENQNHPALGSTGKSPQGARGSTHEVSLHFRRDLSRTRRRRGAHPAALQHPGHAVASG